MKSKQLGIIILVAIVATALSSFIVFSSLKNKTETKEKEKIEYKATSDFGFLFGKNKNIFNNEEFNFNKDYIAVLHIEGVIQKEGRTYNQKWILDTIEKLANDEKNQGILLFIDSPGGTVYESDETYLALIDYKNSTEKPVYAYFASLAASGGYYIGSSADYIFANRNTLTGSIGVIAGQSIDATGLMEKIGIKSQIFHAGRNKTMMSYDTPLTEEQAQIMQSIADEAYEQFTSIVATARRMPIEQVKELADGRIYTANQALKNGLVDKVCSLDDAKAKIEEDLHSELEFEDMKYVYRESIMDLFSSVKSIVDSPKTQMNLNYLAY